MNVEDIPASNKAPITSDTPTTLTVPSCEARGQYSVQPGPPIKSVNTPDAMIPIEYVNANKLIILKRGYATSATPLTPAIAALPAPPNKTGMMNQNTIMRPCPVIARLYDDKLEPATTEHPCTRVSRRIILEKLKPILSPKVPPTPYNAPTARTAVGVYKQRLTPLPIHFDQKLLKFRVVAQTAPTTSILSPCRSPSTTFETPEGIKREKGRHTRSTASVPAFLI